jgi:hypothetical protein
MQMCFTGLREQMKPWAPSGVWKGWQGMVGS